MSTLDQFLPPTVITPKAASKPTANSGIYVEENCDKCGHKILPTEPKYNLTIKGKKGVYHQACAKAILRPQEVAEEV